MNRRVLGLGLVFSLLLGCGDSSSPPVPTRVRVTPGTSSLDAIGKTVQFSATLLDNKDREIEGAVFTWSMSNPQVASITLSGMATGLKEGATSVRAAAEGITGSATLNVDPVPDALEKIAGDQQFGALRQVLPDQLTVEVRDSNGNPVENKFVNFSAVAGGGTASPFQAQTGPDGRASTTWHLGCSNDNPQLLEARIGSLSVSFAANVDLAALAICQESVPGGRETHPYSAQLVAAGGDQGSLNWSIINGGLPPGVTLQPTGSFDGTPTLRGDYQFEAQVLDGLGASASAVFDLKVCDAPVVLNPGQTQAFLPSGPDGCGFFLPSGNNGDRYRFGVVYTRPDTASTDVQTVRVEMRREAGGAVSPEFVARIQLGPDAPSGVGPRLAPRRLPALDHLAERARTREEFHSRIRVAEQELIRTLGPNARPLPDRSGPALSPGPARNAPDKMTFTNSEDFTSCTVDETVRAVKIKENNLLVIYQDSIQWASDPLSDTHAQQMLDYYAASGPQVINSYFGGITDINGDGQVVIFVTPIVDEGVVAFVWSADFYPKTQQIRDGVVWPPCPASNEMEMMRFSHDAIKRMGDQPPSFQALGTVVHEAKHLSSLYKSIIRQEFQPGFVEEGTAEIAEEMASRIAWAATGGPDVGVMANADDVDAFSEENYATVLAIAGAVLYLSSQPNGVVVTPLGAAPGHSIYGSGWHFHRWLGDAYGNAATPMADSALFRTLNDSLSAVGYQGILDLTGAASWAELLGEYLTAIMLNGTEAPQGPRAISSYDFPSITEVFSSPDPDGVYPWPLNVIGEATPAPFFSDTNVGPTGPSGIRIFDLQSDGTGLGLEVVVTAGPASSPFRIVLVRVE